MKILIGRRTRENKKIDLHIKQVQKAVKETKFKKHPGSE